MSLLLIGLQRFKLLLFVHNNNLTSKKTIRTRIPSRKVWSPTKPSIMFSTETQHVMWYVTKCYRESWIVPVKYHTQHGTPGIYWLNYTSGKLSIIITKACFTLAVITTGVIFDTRVYGPWSWVTLSFNVSCLSWYQSLPIKDHNRTEFTAPTHTFSFFLNSL